MKTKLRNLLRGMGRKKKKKSKLNPKLKIKSRNKKQTNISQNLIIEQYNRIYKPLPD